MSIVVDGLVWLLSRLRSRCILVFCILCVGSGASCLLFRSRLRSLSFRGGVGLRFALARDRVLVRLSALSVWTLWWLFSIGLVCV